tara:strand:+ start:52 stop:309 length:258 start_codon:yes stop_codon:yes gene_type:complete
MDENLKHLLIEVHERMYSMMEYCERIQPIKFDLDRYLIKGESGTIDITDQEEMMKSTLFRINDEMVEEDQTTRSILKDLRKYINN